MKYEDGEDTKIERMQKQFDGHIAVQITEKMGCINYKENWH